MHDLSFYSEKQIENRIDILTAELDPYSHYIVRAFTLCPCDDFEVDDGVVVRQCPWNDVNALEAELTRRDMEAAR